MSVNIENEETRKIINFIQKSLVSIHERFDFFDSVIGRRTTITEIKVDKLEKDMNVLGKENKRAILFNWKKNRFIARTT